MVISAENDPGKVADVLKMPAAPPRPSPLMRRRRQGNFLPDAANFAGRDSVFSMVPCDDGGRDALLLLSLEDEFLRDRLLLLVAYALLKDVRDEIRQFS